MMEETLKQSECFLVREEPIRRLSKLVFAVSEACRYRGGGDPQQNRAALSKAIAAQCNLCGFVLSGEELLALAEIGQANENSAMLQRLRGGHCARENCSASHYRLQFYETPEINWTAVLAESRPSEAPQPQPKPAPRPAAPALSPQNRARLVLFGRIFGAIAICLLAWMWWQYYTGGTIPYLRQPEHFKVTPSYEPPPTNHW